MMYGILSKNLFEEIENVLSNNSLDIKYELKKNMTIDMIGPIIEDIAVMATLYSAL